LTQGELEMDHGILGFWLGVCCWKWFARWLFQ
jgi:hypothetical protein